MKRPFVYLLISFALLISFSFSRVPKEKVNWISFAEMEADDVTCTIINSEKEFWEVEEIQDIVKIQLISKSSENPLFVSVAKSYIEYSTTRLNAREWEKSLVENIQKLLNKQGL